MTAASFLPLQPHHGQLPIRKAPLKSGFAVACLDHVWINCGYLVFSDIADKSVLSPSAGLQRLLYNLVFCFDDSAYMYVADAWRRIRQKIAVPVLILLHCCLLPGRLLPLGLSGRPVASFTVIVSTLQKVYSSITPSRFFRTDL